MWDKLSIKDKAEIIKMGVANGIRDLDIIRDTYNNVYAEGGDTNLLNNQDFLNQYGIHWDEDPLMNDYYAQHPSELNKSTTAGMPAAYNNRVLVNRYGVPQSQQSLNRYAKDYALIQPQVSRKEEREVEKRAIDRNIEQNMSQAPLLFSGLSFLNLASPSNIYGTIARQVNPNYYGQGHNWTEDLIFGNAGLFTDKFAEEHPYLSTLGNIGADAVTTAGLYKLANSGISYARNFRNEVLPINENNFYRQVSKEAIDDANKSGLIRGNRYDTDPTRGAFFRLGKYFKNPNKDTYIIEGTPNSAESWIDSWRYNSRRPFIEDEVKKLEIKKQLQPSEFTQKDEDLLSFFSELKNNSMVDVRDPSFLSKKSLRTLEQLKEENPNWLMEFGTEAFPMSEENLNVLNNNFNYWKYHKYRGWRKHNFDKVKNPVNKIEAYLKENLVADGITGAGIIKGANIIKDGIRPINNIIDKYLFTYKPGSYTRGIGMGTEGLDDLIKTGIVRGNPRGTEMSAKNFMKGWRHNRGHFKDIMQDTKIKGIESKYQSRTLTEEEFNAIKKAAKKYDKPKPETITYGNRRKVTILEQQVDPLYDYDSYIDYINDINNTIDYVEKMPRKIASGKVKVNPEQLGYTTTDGIQLPVYRPLERGFSANSDFIMDGSPLSYWYPDGRNPITKGHAYASSKYGVRVNNPEDYTPFMHYNHLHPSFLTSPKLSDSNVELFKRGLFGLTYKLDKNTLKPLLLQDFKNSIKKSPKYSILPIFRSILNSYNTQNK